MASNLRSVKWPGSNWLTDRSRNPVRVQEWLERNAPQLAAIQCEPSEALCDMAGALWQIEGRPVKYTPGFWINRCAGAADVAVWGAIVTSQKEQDLLAPDEPFQSYTAERMPDGFTIPADWTKPAGPIGTRYYLDIHQDRPGCIKVTGDRRMSSCLGFGIPDPGRKAGWSLTAYGPRAIPLFGFCSQVAHFNWFLRRKIDEWEAGHRTVILYTGETVQCEDPLIYWCYKYTPTEGMAEFLCKIAAGKGIE